MKNSIPENTTREEAEVSFGTVIANARIAANLTRQHVATETGISRSLLRFWEDGVVGSPDLAAVMRVAGVLDLDPLYLASLAGYDVANVMPPLQPYLRSRYPQLPAGALEQIAEITRKYGIDPTRSGPAPGEDEQ